MRRIAASSVPILLTACLSLSALGLPAGAGAPQDSTDKKTASKSGDQKEPPPYTGVKHRIAVVGISDHSLPALEADQIAPPPDFGLGLTETLTTALVKSGHFSVFEREKLNEIKQEMTLGASGLVSPDTAVKIGKLAGVEYLITGNITEYSNEKGGGGVAVGGFSVGGRGGTATLGFDLRVIDATTGADAFVVHADGKSNSRGGGVSYVNSNFAIGGGGAKNAPLGKAVRDAMNRAVQSLCDQFNDLHEPNWESEVVDFDAPDTVYVKGGDQAGLKVGDMLEIMTPGKELKDKDGTVLGRKPDRHIALCRVTDVGDKIVTATLTDPGDFKKDDYRTYIVRHVGQPSDGGDKKTPASDQNH